MNANTHIIKCAPEQLQQKSRCPHVTNATQTGSEYLDSTETRNTVQTDPLTEQQGNWCRTDNTALTVSGLPDLFSHPTEPEQFYNEIADEYASRTVAATIGQPVQLPLRVNTHRRW
jgi:hypothetical protein